MEQKKELKKIDNLYLNIKDLLVSAKKQVITTVNSVMTLTYYEIGRKIVEEEQSGQDRAEYGKELLKSLSESLTKDFGKGFGVRNIELIRKFYLIYSRDEKTKSLISKSANPFNLSWTHYIRLMRFEDIEERKFYEIEAKSENWTVREMDRQIDSSLYHRLALSRDKDKVLELSNKGQIIEKPEDIIKDPYILEFLGLPELPDYSENNLEIAIINHIEKFILELGKGFLFHGRQVRFTFEEEHFFVLLLSFGF